MQRYSHSQRPKPAVGRFDSGSQEERTPLRYQAAPGSDYMERRLAKKGTGGGGRRQRLLATWPFVFCALVLLWAYRDRR